MIPWGTLIGLAGQAVSGIASAINNRRRQRAADNEAARQQAYYAAKAAEDPLALSENQRVLNQYDREAQRQVEAARNTAKITGATPEYSLAVQKGVAEGRANLMGNIAAGASQRADYYTHLGEQARHQKALDDQARRAERNTTYANLAANAAKAFGSIMDAYQPKQAPAAPKADAGQQQKNAAALATVTNRNAHKSERYSAAADLTDNPLEKNALQTTATTAQQAEKTVTAQPVATSPTNVRPADPEPDLSDFIAHYAWLQRQRGLMC